MCYNTNFRITLDDDTIMKLCSFKYKKWMKLLKSMNYTHVSLECFTLHMRLENFSSNWSLWKEQQKCLSLIQSIWWLNGKPSMNEKDVYIFCVPYNSQSWKWTFSHTDCLAENLQTCFSHLYFHFWERKIVVLFLSELAVSVHTTLPETNMCTVTRCIVDTKCNQYISEY